MREKELEKIHKLLKQAKSAKDIGSLREAEKFFAKVQEMLDKYNLSMSDLDVLEAANQPINAEGVMIDAGSFTEWQFIILTGVGRVNGCYALISDEIKKAFIVGRAPDRKITLSFFTFINDAARALEKDFETDFIGTLQYSVNHFANYKRQLESYMLGVATAIARRLEATHKKEVDKAIDAAVGEGTSQALVFIEKRVKDCETWAREQVEIAEPKPGEFTSEKIDGELFQLGLAAGGAVPIGEKVLS